MLLQVLPEVFAFSRIPQRYSISALVSTIKFRIPHFYCRDQCTYTAEIQYKCTGLYNKNAESGIFWNDPGIGIKWPIENPILSEKDRNAKTLDKWLKLPESDLFS